MKHGNGYTLTSEDGHIYVDFVAEMTAGLYGHSHPTLISAITDAMRNKGLNLGATTEQESIYAEALCQRFCLENVRFTNSGTEANLHALNAARAFTGRRKILVFDNGYHGSVISFAHGKGAQNNVDMQDWVVARFNDAATTKSLLEEHSDKLAAVIMEGMLGAGGAVPGDIDFLRGVRAWTRENNILLVLDEVLTSRLFPGGMGVKYGLEPDLKTFGKWLGGGLAFGAFGGRADIMSIYDPRRTTALAHSGTFNNNTLAMSAGWVGLTQVFTPDICRELNLMGARLLHKLEATCRKTVLCWSGLGSVIAAHFYLESPDAKGWAYTPEDKDLRELFWLEMMEEGFWIAKRGQLTLVLGTPEEELMRFNECVSRFVEKYQDLLCRDPARWE